jgi:hypothetical protein
MVDVVFLQASVDKPNNTTTQIYNNTTTQHNQAIMATGTSGTSGTSVATKTYGQAYTVNMVPGKSLQVGDRVVTNQLATPAGKSGKSGNTGSKAVILVVSNIVDSKVHFQNQSMTAWLSNYGTTYHPAVLVRNKQTDEIGHVFDMSTNHSQAQLYHIRLGSKTHVVSSSNMQHFEIV